MAGMARLRLGATSDLSRPSVPKWILASRDQPIPIYEYTALILAPLFLRHRRQIDLFRRLVIAFHLKEGKRA